MESSADDAIIVPEEIRLLVVAPEDRTIVIPPEWRVIEVQYDPGQ